MTAPTTSAHARRARQSHAPLLFPREHGAYGQLLFPLATALVLGNGSRSAIAIAAACAAAFVAHESLLVLLGHRGGRAARDHRRAALRWLAACGGLALLAGVYGAAHMPPGTRPSVLVPIALAVVLAPLVVTHREHSAAGEIVAAVGLSSCAVPVALAGDVPAVRAVTCWLVFALAFVAATVAVRAAISRIKNRGSRLADIAMTVPAVVLALAIAAATRGWAGWIAVVALLPVLGFAEVLSVFPPHPRHLRTVGWALVSATATTAIILAVGR